MRVRILPVAIFAALALGSTAYAAAQTANGAVKTFDLAAHRLVLESGIAYNLPANFHDPGLKPGDRVAITWDGMRDGMRNASSVRKAN
jgi:hypothetical protein